MAENSRARVGIVGMPPLAVIRRLYDQGAEIVDLDEPVKGVALGDADNHLPRVYCAILRTVVSNALHLDLDEIYIDVGPGKCDCALHVARVLADLNRCPVHRTRNLDDVRFGNPVCVSGLPLREKLVAITAGVKLPHPPRVRPEPCRPTAAFWGVPPRDFRILELFPDATHVYGWTRCMENKTPADLELEQQYDPHVPTVFFAQSFCAKNALAKHLAALHPCGLYLDCDVTSTSSARAKVEAFLSLHGCIDDTKR